MSNIPETANHDDHTDGQLLELALAQPDSQTGKHAASTLFKRYREPVYRWCLSRVRNPDLALDLSQDVLLNAYRKLHTFGGRAQFSSWLFAIARNRCLNALRRPALFEEKEDLEVVPDPKVRQDQQMEQDEDEERVLRLIRENLAPLDQKVLWMRCFEKVPVDVITRTLEITETSGARGVLQRARRRLRSAMDRQNSLERGAANE